MEKWQRDLARSITDVSVPARRFGLNQDKLNAVTAQFRFKISPYYWQLLQRCDDPLYRQFIPDERELSGNEQLLTDPLGEEKNSPTECIVQRYPDRCLFLVSNQCAAYCRFCTRKRKFAKDFPVDKAHLDAGITYIKKHTEIRDVLISGGDPLLLTDERLEYILQSLRPIKHVEILRIGTRTPCVLPSRITVKLVKMLKKYHPLYINVHFNHPDELTPLAVKALNRLADAGIPLGSQTVLLHGVNDAPETIKLLMHKLLQARVKPYYLFQSDLIYGTEHFRTPLSKALEIMHALHGWTGGMAIPQLAIDLPNGYGKVPIEPQYAKKRCGRTITFENYRGEFCDYCDLSPESAQKLID